MGYTAQHCPPPVAGGSVALVFIHEFSGYMQIHECMNAKYRQKAPSVCAYVASRINEPLHRRISFSMTVDKKKCFRNSSSLAIFRFFGRHWIYSWFASTKELFKHSIFISFSALVLWLGSVVKAAMSAQIVHLSVSVLPRSLKSLLLHSLLLKLL